ncbi:hypothetical protein ALC60_11908 [Trachymyrmex zeteki]|uniref:Uncharacterized protein n=1 Tax=Mycetomoellerius zeteki TaxID=64791 RepID=A0A151WLX9_9HYME|nr:hypothetical protein ALC60_11908 [Trachymyrmex zeteki]
MGSREAFERTATMETAACKSQIATSCRKIYYAIATGERRAVEPEVDKLLPDVFKVPSAIRLSILNLRCLVSLNYYGIYASMLCNWSNYRRGWKQNTCYVHKLQITYSNIGSFFLPSASQNRSSFTVSIHEIHTYTSFDC